MKKTLLAIFIHLLNIGTSAQPTIRISFQEVMINPKFLYGDIYTEIEESTDSTFTLRIFTSIDSVLVAEGGLLSEDPIILDGQYKFYTPSGLPYAVGYYKENVPHRAWTFFDSTGSVTNTIDYSRTLDYIRKYSGIDLDGDYVFWAQRPPETLAYDLQVFLAFLSDQAIYPPLSLIFGQQDMMTCQFAIDKKGQLINPEIIKGGSVEFNLEIARLLALYPKWNPAINEGKPQNYIVHFPVRFSFSADHLPMKPKILEEVAGSYEMIDKDSIHIYFNRSGELASRNGNYYFYRAGKVNRETLLLEGKIIDYNPKGKRLFECEVKDGKLNGDAILYSDIKRISEKGHYSDGQRDGIWTIYYRSGKIKANIRIEEKPYMIEYYKKNGDRSVVDGNGTVKWDGDDNTYQNFKGEIKNGLRVGVWENKVFQEGYDQEGNFLYAFDKFFKEESDKQYFKYLKETFHDSYTLTFIRVR